MAKYEAMLVFSAALDEEATQSKLDKFKKLIEDNGKIESVDEWGKRKLAYEINDQTEGYYVVYEFESEAAFPAELDRIAQITDGVLRSLIVAKGE